MKKGVKEQKKKERRACCVKNRVWIGVGCVGGLVVLILALVLVIRSLIATRESRETLKQLKACLSETVVSRDMTELVVPNNRCNDVVILNMGAFTKLRVLSIGNEAERAEGVGACGDRREELREQHGWIAGEWL